MKKVVSIAPGSNARMGLLVAKTSEKLAQLAETIKDPVVRARLRQRAAALADKGRALSHE